MAKGTQGAGSNDHRHGKGSKWPLASGSWRVQFYIDGKAHRETYPTADAADARLEEVQRLKRAHIEVALGLEQVDTFFTAWLVQRERVAKSPRTMEADRRNIEAYILPAIGTMRLMDVRSHHLQDLLNAVEDGVRQRTHGHHTGTRTAQLVATILTQAFTAAVAQRRIPFSPMDGVIIPTYDRAEIQPADDAGIAAILLVAEQMPVPALWYAYSLLGLRRNEGLGIRLQDVDLKHRTLLIAQQVHVGTGGVFSFPLPKNKKKRLLPYPRLMAPWLEQRVTEVKRLRLAAGPNWHDYDLLFCNDQGAPFWPTTVDHWWHTIRAAAGLPAGLTLHSLRHAFMTMLDETEITEVRKKKIMGHGKTDITEKYTHPGIEVMRKAIEGVAHRVAQAMEQRREATG